LNNRLGCNISTPQPSPGPLYAAEGWFFDAFADGLNPNVIFFPVHPSGE
jgi:hypothetical protein